MTGVVFRQLTLINSNRPNRLTRFKYNLCKVICSHLKFLRRAISAREKPKTTRWKMQPSERAIEREKKEIKRKRVDNHRNLWLKVTTPFYPLMVELTCKRNTIIHMVIAASLWPMQFRLDLFFLPSIIYYTHSFVQLFSNSALFENEKSNEEKKNQKNKNKTRDDIISFVYCKNIYCFMLPFLGCAKRTSARYIALI